MSEFTVNDVFLFYEIKGNPEGKEAVAFLNGVMASTSSWSLIYPIFEKFGFKIILHDFKGQLKSEKPDGPYTFEEHATEAKALYEFLGVEKIHLIGTSYGGEVAMKFAALFPEMTKSISVIDSVSELDEVLKNFVLNWKTLADTKDGEKFFWGMLPSIYGPKFVAENKEMLEERAKLFKNFPEDYYTGQKILYDTFAQDVYMTDELCKISCPALIICGQDDILKKPKFSQILADRIPSSEYVLLPDCGHVAILEAPKELQSILLGFILKNC